MINFIFVITCTYMSLLFLANIFQYILVNSYTLCLSKFHFFNWYETIIPIIFSPGACNFSQKMYNERKASASSWHTANNKLFHFSKPWMQLKASYRGRLHFIRSSLLSHGFAFFSAYNFDNFFHRHRKNRVVFYSVHWMKLVQIYLRLNQ